ncbi:MAG: hypothetical protein EHM87_18725 [Burkholderiales bacterium]|nr:MAG: hypothetical protein EHM87_18725 [Burkholderiales bacterium]
MIRRWFAGLAGRVAADDDTLELRDARHADAGSALQVAPEVAAAHFLADPDRFVSASIGEDGPRSGGAGPRRFRSEVIVAGLTLASVRSGTLHLDDDGESTAEVVHYEVAEAFRGRGLAVPAARSIFRHLHTHHRVTRVLFVAPVLHRQRAPFEGFVARLGAEPSGHFADDRGAPPLYAWSAGKALA